MNKYCLNCKTKLKDKKHRSIRCHSCENKRRLKILKKKIICPICNKKFNKHNYKHNCCSAKCNRRLYYNKNKSIILRKVKKYYLKYKNKLNKIRKKYIKLYKKINKEKIFMNNKIYRSNHKKEIRKYILLYKRKCRKNAFFRLEENLRTRIYCALKKNIKSKSTIKLIGCSIEKLRNHLESQFKLGMTWKNYGRNGWEIDHIKPCASFNLSNPEEQRKCFHYTNLQPLWIKENREKGRK